MMRRDEHSARCALIAKRGGWQLRVLIDRDLLLEQHCDDAGEAFAVADRWKHQMLLDGWHRVLPAATGSAAPGAGEQRG